MRAMERWTGKGAQPRRKQSPTTGKKTTKQKKQDDAALRLLSTWSKKLQAAHLTQNTILCVAIREKEKNTLYKWPVYHRNVQRNKERQPFTDTYRQVKVPNSPHMQVCKNYYSRRHSATPLRDDSTFPAEMSTSLTKEISL